MGNKDQICLLVACLLHSFVLGAVWVRASSPSTNAAVSQSGLDEGGQFDVELMDAKAQPTADPSPPLLPTAAVPSHAGKRSSRASSTITKPTDAPQVEEIAAPNTTATVQVEPSQTPPLAMVPGLDGKPIWALPGVMPAMPAPALGGAARAAPAPVIPNPPPANTGPVAKVLDYLASGNPPKPSARIAPIQHFPAAGTLASAIATEIRGSSTPPNSNGIFELVVDAKGLLVSVQVVHADPDYRKEWDRVAGSIARRFLGQTFPLPDAYAGGSRIRVAVTSQLVMPDGTPHGVPAPAAKIPTLPNEQDVRIESMENQYRAGNGKAAVPPIKLAGGVSLDFDIANLGAKRRRVVHTRVTAAPLAKATSQGASDPRR